MSDVIYTPVYRNTTYLYHECSECEYHVRMEQSVLAPLYFGESFKFCPNCGKPVVRFANLPKFKEEFNTAVFKDLEMIDDEYQDKLDYYCRVTLSREEFEILRKECVFAVNLYEKGGLATLKPAVRAVAKMNTKPWNHWNIQKLKERISKNDDE